MPRTLSLRSAFALTIAGFLTGLPQTLSAQDEPTASFTVTLSERLFIYADSYTNPADDTEVMVRAVTFLLDPRGSEAVGEREIDFSTVAITVEDGAGNALTEGAANDYILDGPDDSERYTLIFFDTDPAADPDFSPDEFVITMTIDDDDLATPTSAPFERNIRELITYRDGDFTLTTIPPSDPAFLGGLGDDGFDRKPLVNSFLWQARLTNNTGVAIDGPLELLADIAQEELPDVADEAAIFLLYSRGTRFVTVDLGADPEDAEDDEIRQLPRLFLPDRVDPSFSIPVGGSVDLALEFRNTTRVDLTDAQIQEALRFVVRTSAVGTESIELFEVADDESNLARLEIRPDLAGNTGSSMPQNEFWFDEAAFFIIEIFTEPDQNYQVQYNDGSGFVASPYLINQRGSRLFWVDYSAFPKTTGTPSATRLYRVVAEP